MARKWEVYWLSDASAIALRPNPTVWRLSQRSFRSYHWHLAWRPDDDLRAGDPGPAGRLRAQPGNTYDHVGARDLLTCVVQAGDYLPLVAMTRDPYAIDVPRTESSGDSVQPDMQAFTRLR